MRIRIRDPDSFWPWIRDGKIRIRDKHSGYATLILTSKLIKKKDIPKTAEETGGCGFLNSEVLAVTAASDPPKTKDFLARVTGLGRKEEPW
jgi:hypothetical protein